LARIGVTLDSAHPAGGFHVRTERDQIFAQGRIGRDGERTVPELAIEMLGVITLDALAAAEAHVDRSPCREEGGQRAHICGRRPAPAKARCHTRIAGFVEQAALACGIQLLCDECERLLPRDPDESRVFPTTLP